MSVGRSWTSWAGTGEPARDLAGCVQERCPWNERWRESAGEAGATVRCNCRLRDMNVTVRADDERVLEVLASGLPLHHGAQLAVDITLRSALTSAGLPSPNAAHVNGAALARARRDKERKWGRWRQEAYEFVNSMAAARTSHPAPFSAFGVAAQMDEDAGCLLW